MKSANTECESEHDFGDMTYVINGKDYTIPSSHWMERKILTSGKSTCHHSIGTLDVGQKGLHNLFIAGDAFMQIFYTVFDRDTSTEYPLGRVGLAKAKHTAPEQIVHWNEHGKYVNEEYVCEESFIPKSVCDNYQPSHPHKK